MARPAPVPPQAVALHPEENAAEGQQARATPTVDALFRLHARYVGAVALRILGRRDEVDDLVQDVFIAAMRGLHQVRDPATIKAWLVTIAVRLARKRLRQRRARAWLGLAADVDYSAIAGPEASPEERLVLQRVYQCLDTLPADQRLAWTLRHIEGEALQRVAELCRCSLATAKRRIAAAGASMATVLDNRISLRQEAADE